MLLMKVDLPTPKTKTCKFEFQKTTQTCLAHQQNVVNFEELLLIHHFRKNAILKIETKSNLKIKIWKWWKIAFLDEVCGAFHDQNSRKSKEKTMKTVFFKRRVWQLWPIRLSAQKRPINSLLCKKSKKNQQLQNPKRKIIFIKNLTITLIQSEIPNPFSNS